MTLKNPCKINKIAYAPIIIEGLGCDAHVIPPKTLYNFNRLGGLRC